MSLRKQAAEQSVSDGGQGKVLFPMLLRKYRAVSFV